MFTYFRRRRLRQRARTILAQPCAGSGLYEYEWRAPAHGSTITAATILHWCRETIATTRRPWGIAEFDLALSSSIEGRQSSLSFRRLAPTDLYPGDSLLSELERFLGPDGPDGPDGTDNSVSHLAAVLFSWGDAAHALGTGD